MKLLMESWNKFVTEVADAGKLDPKLFPKDLDNVDAARAKQLVTTGDDDVDGGDGDDVIPTGHKPQGVASVQKLKPSQSSMNIKKALQFVIQMLHPKGKLNAGGDLGAFISKDGYIMDGHHRWIATAMIDPSLSVGGYLVDFPGEQLVAVLNAMTKGFWGDRKGKEASGGFEQFKEGPIRQMLIKLMKEGVWDNLGAEDVVAVIEKWTGQQGEAAVEAAVDKLVQNLSTLTMATPSWASGREQMPVIDDEAHPGATTAAAKALNVGSVNVNPPYKKGGQQPQQQQVATENRKRARRRKQKQGRATK
jgi:hypothetical protein